jgi:hypothetical protein
MLLRDLPKVNNSFFTKPFIICIGRYQGCQIFLGKNTKTGKNIPNYHELYQLSIKYV